MKSIAGWARKSSPETALADPGLVDRLRSIPGAPWDVFSSQELADALETDVLALADWRYRRKHHAPPHENPQLYPGKKALFRKDRIITWAQRGGRSLPHSMMWEAGADHLHSVFMLPRAASALETDQLLVQMQLMGYLPALRHPPRVWPFAPYADIPGLWKESPSRAYRGA
jgi:hypothetical protein